MFSDPWIMGGAGVMITIIAIAAAVRLYNRLKVKAEAGAKKPSA